MEKYQLQIIETLTVIVVFIALQFLNNKLINNTMKKYKFHRDRRKISIKVINFLTAWTAIIFLTGIWGLNQNELLLFFTSTLAVLGIAFFAQWSILSNITSSLILFFNHPLKIGDTIKIIDKEQPVEGVIQDIGYFFLHIKINDNENVTIPNSVVMQKTISIKSAD